MPERINVVRLSEQERDTLRDVTAAAEVKALAAEVAKSLRAGSEGARAAATAVEVDAEKFTALREELNQRLSTLSALPVTDDVKEPLTSRTRSALGLVEEALRMLDHG